MKLHYWRTTANFGDQLNAWIWDKVLPGIFDEDPEVLFFGIGTLLNGEAPRAKRVVVLGTGVGYGAPISEPDPSWEIYCVRGPLSAMALGLSTSAAASDPAILIPRLFESTGARRHRFAFMPHWRSASELHKRLCSDLGVNYVSPAQPVEQVLEQIASSEVMITEAMHGAIAADALRVPWVAVHDKRNEDTLLSKWQDWCLSLALDHQPKFLTPEEDFDAQMRRLMHTARPRLSRQLRFQQALDRVDRAIDRFKDDLELGKFRAVG